MAGLVTALMALAALGNLGGIAGFTVTAGAAALPVVPDVEWQPLSAQVQRVIEALDYLGTPLESNDRKRVERPWPRATARSCRR